MNRELLVDRIRAVRESVEAEGATALYLYGSRARGDHQATSDVDLFVDYDPARKFSLFDLAGVKLAIEDAVGLEVHVTTRDSLHPRLREIIEQTALRIF